MATEAKRKGVSREARLEEAWSETAGRRTETECEAKSTRASGPKTAKL